jgi:hypothetical protein
MRRFIEASVTIAPPVQDFDGVFHTMVVSDAHVAGGVLPNCAVAAEAAHERAPAVDGWSRA